MIALALAGCEIILVAIAITCGTIYGLIGGVSDCRKKSKKGIDKKSK